jgi:hypothetical protein
VNSSVLPEPLICRVSLVDFHQSWITLQPPLPSSDVNLWYSSGDYYEMSKRNFLCHIMAEKIRVQDDMRNGHGITPTCHSNLMSSMGLQQSPSACCVETSPNDKMYTVSISSESLLGVFSILLGSLGCVQGKQAHFEGTNTLKPFPEMMSLCTVPTIASTKLSSILASIRGSIFEA